MKKELTKVLHLSHHYGCLKDHQYVCDRLQLQLESEFSAWPNGVLPKGSYKMTDNLSRQIWDQNEEYFNSFDFVTTSDTAPLSRIFLQNIDKFRGKLNIWVCNRFDYQMAGDSSFYRLFDGATRHSRVNVIPYTEFERVYMNRYNIHTDQEVIRPIGKTIPKLLSEYDLVPAQEDVTQDKLDVLVSRYHNDNIFQNSKNICKSLGLKAEHGPYHGAEGLKKLIEQFHCFFFNPDAYSKFTTFEMMQLGMPTIIPSESYLLRNSRKSNYFFSTGVSEETVHLCEWYNEYCKQYVLYIDGVEEIPAAVDKIKSNAHTICKTMKATAQTHTEKTLAQWRNIYDR